MNESIKEKKNYLYNLMIETFTKYTSECKLFEEVVLKINEKKYRDNNHLKELLNKYIDLENRREEYRKKSNLYSKKYLDYIDYINLVEKRSN